MEKLVITFFALVVAYAFVSKFQENMINTSASNTPSQAIDCVRRNNNWVGRCIPPNLPSIRCVTTGGNWVNSRCETASSLKEMENVMACVKGNGIFSNNKCIKSSEFCPKCQAHYVSKLGMPEPQDVQMVETKMKEYGNGLEDVSIRSGFPIDQQLYVKMGNVLYRMNENEKYVVARLFLHRLKIITSLGNFAGFETNILPFIYFLFRCKDNKSPSGDTIDIGQELALIVKDMFTNSLKQ